MIPQEGAATTQEEIDGYDAEIARLKRQLKDAQNKRGEALCRPWGIAVDQTVRSTSRRHGEGKLGKIVSFEAPYALGQRPWISVRLQNRDGSFGNRVVNFFGDWERVEDSAIEVA